MFTLRELRDTIGTMLRSSVMGFGIGVLPRGLLTGQSGVMPFLFGIFSVMIMMD